MGRRNDLRYNASGYRDDTAYQAIKNIMRENYIRKKKLRMKSGSRNNPVKRPSLTVDVIKTQKQNENGGSGK